MKPKPNQTHQIHMKPKPNQTDQPINHHHYRSQPHPLINPSTTTEFPNQETKTLDVASPSSYHLVHIEERESGSDREN